MPREIEFTPDLKEEGNPLDALEALAAKHDWLFCRESDDEIILLVVGENVDYQISFTWMDDIGIIHLASAFEQKISEPRKPEVLKLATLINEQLWVGHFDVWFNDDIIMFRLAHTLDGKQPPTDDQYRNMLAAALDTCARFYPAFQFVLWAGKSAEEAYQAVDFAETKGTA